MPGLSFSGPVNGDPVLLVKRLDPSRDSDIAGVGGCFTSTSIHGGPANVNPHFIPDREAGTFKRLRLAEPE
jgi:hypothetical protein